MRFRSSLIFSLLSLSACSVYQSEGRKFLEKQAFEYAGVQAHLVSCQNVQSTDGLTLIHSEPRAEIFSSAINPLAMRVVPLGDRPYSCDYGFTSTDEMAAQFSPAIGLTLHNLQQAK